MQMDHDELSAKLDIQSPMLWVHELRVSEPEGSFLARTSFDEGFFGFTHHAAQKLNSGHNSFGINLGPLPGAFGVEVIAQSAAASLMVFKNSDLLPILIRSHSSFLLPICAGPLEIRGTIDKVRGGFASIAASIFQNQRRMLTAKLDYRVK